MFRLGPCTLAIRSSDRAVTIGAGQIRRFSELIRQANGDEDAPPWFWASLRSVQLYDNFPPR